jgi:hypothetical protein
LDAIQGEIKEEFRDIRETIMEIKNEIKQEEIDTLGVNEHIRDEVKSGLNDIQNKIDQIKSDAGSNQLELKNDIISVIKTELNNMQEQIQLIQKDTLGQFKNDADLMDTVNVALLDIHEQIKKAGSGNGSTGIDDEAMGELKAEFQYIQKQIKDIKIETSIQKRYIGEGTICEVTFTFPRVASPGARKVALVGDFNGWDKNGMLMNKLESGDFTLDLALESGREYRFKYLIDDERWENDWHADKYLPSPNGYDDSVVLV